MNKLIQRGKKRVLFSVLIILALILSSSGILNQIVLETPLINYVDRSAQEYYGDSLKRALAAFAIARGLNAGISFLQEVEITPVVASFPVGEVLDPVNDLVERFSMVMLVSSASLGIQRILMEIGIWLGFKVLLSISLLVLLISLWMPERSKRKYLKLGTNLAVVSIVVRFCIPTIGMATNEVYRLFLKDKTEAATASIENSKAEIESVDITEEEEGVKVAAVVDESDPSLWERMKGMYNTAKSQVDIKGKLDHLKTKVSSTMDSIIDMIVVFILQTIVIPIVVLFGMISLVKSLTGKSFSGIEGKVRTALEGPTVQSEAG